MFNEKNYLVTPTLAYCRYDGKYNFVWVAFDSFLTTFSQRKAFRNTIWKMVGSLFRPYVLSILDTDHITMTS